MRNNEWFVKIRFTEHLCKYATFHRIYFGTGCNEYGYFFALFFVGVRIVVRSNTVALTGDRPTSRSSNSFMSLFSFDEDEKVIKIITYFMAICFVILFVLSVILLYVIF